MSAPENPSAFPHEFQEEFQDEIADGKTFRNSRTVCRHGMELRDYFAAHALPITGFTLGPYMDDKFFVDVAATAYRIADAMLAERRKKP